MLNIIARSYEDGCALSLDGKYYECIWPDHHAKLTVHDDGTVSGKYSKNGCFGDIVMAPSFAEATAFAFEIVPYMKNEHSPLMFLAAFDGEKMKRKG